MANFNQSKHFNACTISITKQNRNMLYMFETYFIIYDRSRNYPIVTLIYWHQPKGDTNPLIRKHQSTLSIKSPFHTSSNSNPLDFQLIFLIQFSLSLIQFDHPQYLFYFAYHSLDLYVSVLLCPQYLYVSPLLCAPPPTLYISVLHKILVCVFRLYPHDLYGSQIFHRLHFHTSTFTPTNILSMDSMFSTYHTQHLLHSSFYGLGYLYFTKSKNSYQG